MTLEISDVLLQQVGLSPAQLRVKIAIALYQDETFSMGQASALAEMPKFQFQKELGKRGIPIHYGVDELHKDVMKLEEAFHDRRK